jgi:hypothetical protein
VEKRSKKKHESDASIPVKIQESSTTEERQKKKKKEKKQRHHKARNDEAEEQAANTSQPGQNTEYSSRSEKKKHKKRKHTKNSSSSDGADVDISKSNIEEESVPKKQKTDAGNHAQVSRRLSFIFDAFMFIHSVFSNFKNILACRKRTHHWRP